MINRWQWGSQRVDNLNAGFLHVMCKPYTTQPNELILPL